MTITMTGQDCLAETLAFNADFETRPPARNGNLDAATIAALRRNRLGGDTPPVRLSQGRDRTVAGVPVRTFTPAEARAVYLHIHGGAWAFGSADGQDERLWRLAVSGRVAVVSVGYRLAPEHPYPSGVDDCVAVARWLVARARAEFGVDRLLIGGESAGAHLSVLTMLQLRGAFRAAHLSFGPYDLSGTPSQRLFGSRALLSNSDTLRTAFGMFAPGRSAEELRDPAISPLYADLSGMPPARLMVGTEDPLLDDSLFLAARWPAAAEMEVVAGAMHGFTLFPLAITEREDERQAAFLGAAAAG
jgi:acetyl esterase/lipase